MDKSTYETVLNNHGATIKNNHVVNYKTGYQVAINNKEQVFYNLDSAFNFIKENKLNSIGLWFDNGKWYLDTNVKRISTKKEAVKLAKENHQIGIWNWNKKETVYIS